METKTIITIIFWVLIAAFVIPNYIQGFQKIISQKEKVEAFTKWGFSLSFMKFLGWVEIVGSTLLLFPQTRLIAIIIYAVLLSGAVYTHLKNNDAKKEVMTPIIVGVHMLVMLTLTYWM
ncbi:MAG TPA: DoxX family protein [Bacteroidia bacterium]|nr:DoxX family protein [Bacteroidia bacterium]